MAGVSVMEMSHRSKEFISIASKAEADLRTLLGIPDDYHVLFMQVRLRTALHWWWWVGRVHWVLGVRFVRWHFGCA